MDSIDRRQLMTGAVVLAGATAVAACGGTSSTTASTSTPASTADSSAASAPASEGAGMGSSSVLTQTTEVPVGGGIIVEKDGQKFAVTQPAAGTFACFSAVCPHQGCNCNQIADGTIDCPCHSSKFAIATGEVVKGPATTGLTPAPITVTGTDITFA